MRRFNLIDEKWIPVRLLDGSRAELGVEETLLRAKEIAAIEDASPLVVAALHRFLLAVLYRALEGPTDRGQSRKLFKEGLPEASIVAYLRRWRDRFWLFDKTHPFMQVPTFEPKNWRAWSALAVEHNADNAKVLFDHVSIDAAGSVTCAAAARWILATQTFSVSCGKSELAHTGTAPSATAVMALPMGQTLQDTLVFSLVPQNRQIIAADKPCWERDPERVEQLKKGIERPATGLADRYTWPIRSIRIADEGEDGVAKIALASGVGCLSTEQVDPMLPYRVDERDGRKPLQFEERGIWRDFDSLLPDPFGKAPQVIDIATELTRFDLGRFPRTVMVLGLANNKAKIEFWRMERFSLPRALAGDRSIRAEIRQWLNDANSGQKTVEFACSTYARNLLTRGDRPPDQKAVKKFVEQMPTQSHYWSSLESSFHQLLNEFSAERSSEDMRWQWLICVRRGLTTAWGQHRASVATGDAWAIRALVKAEAPVRKKLFELKEEIEKLKPQKEAV